MTFADKMRCLLANMNTLTTARWHVSYAISIILLLLGTQITAGKYSYSALGMTRFSNSVGEISRLVFVASLTPCGALARVPPLPLPPPSLGAKWQILTLAALRG